jgi:hypothetical protein
MSKNKKVLSVWLDDTTDANDPKWIVSRDDIAEDGRTDHTQTLKVFDAYDDAVAYAVTKAHDLEMCVYKTENVLHPTTELIYEPFGKIKFFRHQNGMVVWAGTGRVLKNKDIVDCALDFGVDDYEEIYEAISEEISEGETEGSFSTKYEVKYNWELTNNEA